MKIYNTLTKRKEEFVPVEPGKVKMYVCGPTVYNFIHIGNARPMIVFDTVRRYFEYKGYDVNYVSNFTDVDDKIIKKAIEEHKQVLYLLPEIALTVQIMERLHRVFGDRLGIYHSKYSDEIGRASCRERV